MLVPDHEFYQAFGRLEGKIDLILSRSDETEKRLRDLETWRWKAVGAATALSTIVSVVITVLSLKLK